MRDGLWRITDRWFGRGGRLGAVILMVLACGSASETAPEDRPRPVAMPRDASASPLLRLSDGGRYRVSLRPASGEVPLGRIHSWIFHVETLDGEYFAPARITVGGGMPQHGHGFTTDPRVTQVLAEGDFLVEGVKFHMSGDWIIRFEVVGAGSSDMASFDVHVEQPGEAAERSNEWSPAEIRLLKSLSISSLPAPEPSLSNPVVGDPRAARLGHRLFFEPRLSANAEISCASCHLPELYFSDGRARSMGLAETSRNAPTVVGLASSSWFFWDGRRDSLWAQALAPMEAAAEMGNTRLAVVRFVTRDPRYRDAYREIFGVPPDFADESVFPAQASPYGDGVARAAWQALPAERREQVNRAFANVGKAIAAYERLLVPGVSRFDAYADALGGADTGPGGGPLSQQEVAGLRLFVDAGRTQCLRCHNGPLLTNQSFHDIATGRLGALPDLGRFLGAQSLLLDEFNCLGPYSDSPAESCRELEFLDRRTIGEKAGAFKTPTLRGVAETAPYLHDGSMATLEEVMDHYRDPPPEPGHELTPLELSDEEVAQLIAFLRALSGGVAADPVWLAPPSS